MGNYFNNKYMTNKYFGGSDSESISSKIGGLEKSLGRQGVTPPPVSPRSSIDRIFDALSIGQYAVLGGLKNITDNDLSTKFGQGVWNGVKAANPFGDGFEEGEANTSDVLTNMGWNPTTGLGKFAKGTVGFAGDVLLDPTTYMTLGAKPILQGTAKSLGKIGKEAAIGKEAMQEAIDTVVRKQAPEVLQRLGFENIPEATEGLIGKVKRTSKYFPTETKGMRFGSTEFISDKALREFGDRTVAPMFNKIADGIKGHDITKALKKTTDEVFFSGKRLNLIEQSRKDPMEVFRTLATKQAQNINFNKASKLSRQLVTNAQEMMKDATPEKRKLYTEIMETPDVFEDILVEIGTKTQEDLTPQAKELLGKLQTAQKDIQVKVDLYTQAGAKKEEIDKLMALSETINDMTKGDIDTQDIFKSLLDKGNSAVEPIRSLPKDKMYTILNDMRNDEVNTIVGKLNKLGYQDAQDMAYQIREALDVTISKYVEPKSQRYFKGLEEFDGSDIGEKAYQALFDESEDGWKIDYQTRKALKDGRYTEEQILQSINKQTGDMEVSKQVLDNIKGRAESGKIRDAEIKAKSERHNRVIPELKRIVQDRNRQIEKLTDLIPEIPKKQEYINKIIDGTLKQNNLNIELRKLDLPDFKVEKIIQEVENMMKKLETDEQMFARLKAKGLDDEDIAKQINQAKSKKNYLSDDYMFKILRDNGYSQEEAYMYLKQAKKSALGDVEYEAYLEQIAKEDGVKKAKDAKAYADEVGVTDFDEIDAKRLKYFDQKEYETRVKPKEKEYVNSTKVEYDDNELRKLVYKAFDDLTPHDKIRTSLAKYVGKDNVDKTFKKYLNEYADVDNVSKKIPDTKSIVTEAERKSIISFASEHKMTEKQIKHMLDNPKDFTDLAAMVKRSEIDDGVIRSMIDNRMNKVTQQPFIEKGYFNAKKTIQPKAGLHAKYEMNGATILDSIDNPSNVKPSMVLEGTKHIMNTNERLGALLQDVKVVLSDVDTKAEGVYQSIKKDGKYEDRIILPKNKVANSEAELQERIVQRILSHEFAHKSQRELGLDRATWDSIMNMDKKALDIRGGANEDLAESVSLYMRNPMQLRGSFPQRFKAIDDAIKRFKPSDAEWARMKADEMTDAGFQIPKSARQTIDGELDVKMKSYDDILTEATQHGDEKQLRADLVQANKNLEEDSWRKTFKDTFGHEKTHEMVMETITKTMRVLDESKLKKEWDLNEKDIQTLNYIKEHFRNMAETEGIDNVVKDYVTHMFSDEMKEKIGKAVITPDGKSNSNWNPYNLERQYKETIKEFNARVKEKYGVEEAFETDMSKIYIARALKHNQLLFKKQTYERLVDTLGTVVKTADDISIDKKLFASVEDVQSILRTIKPDNIVSVVKSAKLPEAMETKMIDLMVGGNYNIVLDKMLDAKEITQEQFEMLNKSITESVTAKHTQYLKDIGLPTELVSSTRAVVQIDTNVFNGFKKINEKFGAFHMPKTAIDMVNEMGLSQMKDDKHHLLNLYDKALNLWKVNATAVNPGFHFRNAYSNLFQEYLTVGKNALDIDTQGKAFQMSQHIDSYDDVFTKSSDVKRFIRSEATKDNQDMIREALDGMTQFEDLLRQGKTDEALKIVTNISVPNQEELLTLLEKATKNETTMIKTANGKEYSMVKIKSLAQELGVIDTNFFKGDGYKDIRNPLDDLVNTAKDGSIKTKDKLQKVNPLNAEEFVPYKVGREAGSFVEGQARLANFIANIKMGKDPYEAADNVLKFMFDYTDLSDIEKNWMKRAVPFYTWMRKNVPLQIEQLFAQPNTYRGAAKLTNNVRNMTPEKDRVDKEDMNAFAREWLQLPIKTKNSKGKSEPVFLNPNLPYADLNKLSANPTNTLKEMIGSLSPFIKIPIEIGMNKNMFFDSPISRGIGDTNDAPGYLQPLLGGTKKNPAQMSPEIRYILRNIGSLENVSKILEKSSEKVDGQLMSDKGLALLNALGGIKLYSYDVDKYKEWADKDRLKQLQDIQRREVKKRVAMRK